MYKNALLTVLCTCYMLACNIKKLDTSKMVEEMKKRELKRITEPEIVALGTDFSKEIIMNLTANGALADSLSKSYNAKIKEIDISKPFESKEPKETELMKAVVYALQNNIAVAPTLQKINGGLNYVVFAPVSGNANAIWRIELSKKEIILRSE